MPGLFQRVLGRQGAADAPPTETPQATLPAPRRAAHDGRRATAAARARRRAADDRAGARGRRAGGRARRGRPEESWRRPHADASPAALPAPRPRARPARPGRPHLRPRPLRPRAPGARAGQARRPGGARHGAAHARGRPRRGARRRRPARAGHRELPALRLAARSEAKFCSNCGLPVGPGAALPPGPTATSTDADQPAGAEPVPGAAAAITDTSGT